MNRVKIKLVSIGHLPLNFQPKKMEDWKSSLFEVNDKVENFALRCQSDRDNWEFSDNLLSTALPSNSEADFMIAIVNIPIEDNWYTRVLGNNQIIFTFHEIVEILDHSNIPLENVIYRLLYAYALVYREAGNRIPDFNEFGNFSHDETRGCLFDINGIKTDLVASCNNPIICDECQERLRVAKVSQSQIKSSQKEIKKIKQDLYYRILGHVKKHPVCTLAISSFFALALGVSGSVIGSYAYSYIKTEDAESHDTINGSN